LLVFEQFNYIRIISICQAKENPHFWGRYY